MSRSEVPLITTRTIFFLMLQICFSAFDKATNPDVLDHHVLNFIIVGKFAMSSYRQASESL